MIDLYECKLNLCFLPKRWFSFNSCTIRHTQCNEQLGRSRSKCVEPVAFITFSPSLKKSNAKLQIKKLDSKCTTVLIIVQISYEKFMRTCNQANANAWTATRPLKGVHAT